MPAASNEASSLPGTLPKRPEELPHGLIKPPDAVRAIVAREKVKFPPEIFTPEAEERLANDLTLQYYFDPPGYDVAYRSTQHGPEVLAVGEEEIDALRESLGEDEWRTLESWQSE